MDRFGRFRGPFDTLSTADQAPVFFGGLVENGGFEEGLTGWTAITFQEGGVGITGATGDNLNGPVAKFDFTNAATRGIERSFAVTPGRTYAISLKTFNAGAAGSGINVEIRGNVTGGGTLLLDDDSLTATGLNNLSTTFRAGASDTIVSLRLRTRNNGVYDTEVDSVRVTDAVPTTDASLADLTLTLSVAMTAVDTSVAYADPGDALTFTASGLPAGLSLSPAGSLTGTPTELVTARVVTITATDSVGNSVSSSFQITVQAAAAFTAVIVPVWTQSNGGTDVEAPNATAFPPNTFYWDQDTDAEQSATGGVQLYSTKNVVRFGPMVQWAIRFRADNPTVKIMIVDLIRNAADIETLQKGTDNYADWIEAIGQAHTALVAAGETVEFYQGIMQQGESDFTTSENYRYQLRQMLSDIRADVQTETGVNIDTMPWTLGLPTDDFIAERSETGPDDVPAIILETPDYVRYTAVADTRTVDAQVGDIVHFSEAGANEAGNIHYNARATAVANTTLSPPAFTSTTPVPTFSLVKDAGDATLPAFTSTTPIPTINVTRT